MKNTDHEVVIAGPAETGKTLAACEKVHFLASSYPGCQGAIVRKSQKSVYGSVLQTFNRVIEGAPVVAYGGIKPEKYIYANGSEVWVGGMDNPDKILSSERDFVYVNQAEELKIDDWEKLATRTTGRNAVIPHTQLMGDCNPAGSRHWIRERAKTGNLTMIPSTHRDNPTLFDPKTGEITAQGKRTISVLETLTGVRRKRLLEGIWATAEGAVYDMFNVETHVIERPPEQFVSWMLAMDEGYTNPAVILLVGEDGDGRLHIEREFYKSGVLQKTVVATAAAWCEEVMERSKSIMRNDGMSEYDIARKIDRVNLIAVDAAAAGLIADLKDIGLPAAGYKGRVLDGITAVQSYLQVAGDGRPRLTMDPACVNAVNEFESYVWKPEKDEPLKENDHIMDAIRYLVQSVGYPVGAELVAFVG